MTDWHGILGGLSGEKPRCKSRSVYLRVGAMQWPDIGTNGSCSFFVHFFAIFPKTPEKPAQNQRRQRIFLDSCGSFARSCAPWVAHCWQIACAVSNQTPICVSTYAIDAASGLSRAGPTTDQACCTTSDLIGKEHHHGTDQRPTDCRHR
ncbi:hypothetical protein AWT69_004052 [Pseudomonas putida]|nr:hypothetical protein AWT69_004052 [Pseudomonas putida]